VTRPLDMDSTGMLSRAAGRRDSYDGALQLGQLRQPWNSPAASSRHIIRTRPVLWCGVPCMRRCTSFWTSSSWVESLKKQAKRCSVYETVAFVHSGRAVLVPQQATQAPSPARSSYSQVQSMQQSQLSSFQCVASSYFC
jgi:hypothetical protein